MDNSLVIIQKSIITNVSGMLGQEEITPNQGFKNNNGYPMLQHMMSVGWYKNASWCAAVGIWAWEQAYSQYPDILKVLRGLVSLNSQDMGRNFHRHPTWPTSTTVIIPGSLIIYGDGDSLTVGHTATDVDDPDIIETIASGHYHTVEGNTIPDGNPGDSREGYIVASHTHTVGMPHSQKGLNFIRAIHPISPDFNLNL